MKKAMVWLTCMALAAGLVGCGSQSSSSGTEAAAPAESAQESVQEDTGTTAGTETAAAATETMTEAGAEKTDYSDVEFRIAWWGGDARNTQTVDIIENFEKQYPNLTIDVEYGSFSDYFTKLTTQATAGNLPDVYMMDYSKIIEYVGAGQMEPLDAYIENGTIDLSEVDDSMVSGGIVDGTMYAIATGVNAPSIFYDPVILEEAGFTLKQNPTWSELKEVIMGVYEKTGYRAYVDPLDISLEVYIRSIGKEMFTPGTPSFGFGAEDFAAYLEEFYDLYETEAVINSAEFDGDVDGSMWEDNKLWMKFVGQHSNEIVAEEEGSGKELYLCCNPSDDNAQVSGTYLKPVMLWGISSTSANKDLAAEFINYFVNDSYVYQVCGTDRGIPISASMRKYIEENGSELDQRISEFISFLSNGVATEISAPAPTGATEAKVCLGEVMEQLYYGQLGREELLDAAASAIEEGNAVLESASASQE